LHYAVRHGLIQIRILAKSLEIASLVVFLSPLHYWRDFGYDDSTETVLEGVSVDEDLADERSVNVNIFKFLGSDVFTLGKLENVFGAVNNFDRTVGENLANVTRVEPSILIKGFFVLIRALVVPRGHVTSKKLDFSTRVRLVGGEILHLRKIFQSELGAFQNSANMSSPGVFSLGHTACSGCLRQSIPFVDRSAERNLKEVHHVNVDGSGASHHLLYISSKECSNFVEHKHVIAGAEVGSLSGVSAKCGHFVSDSLINQPLLASSGVVHVVLDFTVDLVE